VLQRPLPEFYMRMAQWFLGNNTRIVRMVFARVLWHPGTAFAGLPGYFRYVLLLLSYELPVFALSWDWCFPLNPVLVVRVIIHKVESLLVCLPKSGFFVIR